ncbi:tryptophan--tRNA ligase [Demequina sp. NBRC 110053]|uniref:tryptophan--tRNA ligase n=1 Tax=Demequina sp. NBRC 110053 TaxID=1570342 RepID=UPI000A00D9FA|nr:tryptophan--tRNA ligase [Demequina sp. NBRC 110053]
MKPRVFSAMQPTADSLQLGNYLGALVQWVRLQDTHDAIYSVVDLHALTVAPDPEVLRRRSRATAAQFLAAGVDPQRSIVFLQSHVAEHAQLAWLLSTFTGMGEAGRMTQFKDKSAKVGEAGTNVGLFTYPILMAADILLYDTDLVPVGEDQRQHLELSRDLAERLNTRLGEGSVVVPDAHIVESVAKIYDLQDPTKKMSKSAVSPKGTIEILQDPRQVAKNIKSAATDSDAVIAFDREAKAGVSNLLTIYSALDGRSVEQLVADYEGKMYGHLKVDLAEVVVSYLTPLRDSAMEWIESPARLDSVLEEGAAKARTIASATLARLYERVGLVAPTSRR